MKHPETHAVTATYGPRPAGPPDECFYCQVKVGGEHKPGCVLRQRTVVLRYSYDVVIAVPADWDKRMVEFHRNDSSWCADNSLPELNRHAQSSCWCPQFTASFVREATAVDEVPFQLNLLES